MLFQGWINDEKIKKYAYPPSLDTKVLVCGLPGVYDKLCGPRSSQEVAEGSVLYNLGYDGMVVKL